MIYKRTTTMRKMKICMWTGTRRRSNSRLSRVVGLAGESGCTYSKGLPAAPLMGFRRVALKKNQKQTGCVSRSSYNSLILIIMLVVRVSPPHLLFLYISSNSVTPNSHSTIDNNHTAAILESSNVILLSSSFPI